MKKIMQCGLVLLYATSLSAAEMKNTNSPKPLVLTLTREEAAALPQILDIAIKQMGLNPGSLIAIQIAQALAAAQQPTPPVPEKPTK